MTQKILLLVVVAGSFVNGHPDFLPARLPPGYRASSRGTPGYSAHTPPTGSSPNPSPPTYNSPDPTYSSPEHSDPVYRAPSHGRTSSASSSHSDNTYDDAAAQRPAQYNFQYDAQDASTGRNFGHQETRDGYDTQGSYYVPLSDGRVQKVTYYVTADSGFVAEITYEGEATYPKPQYIDGSSQQPAVGPRHRPGGTSHQPAAGHIYSPGYRSASDYESTPTPSYQPTPGASYEVPEEYETSATSDHEVAPSNEAVLTYESPSSQNDQQLSSDQLKESIYT